MHAVADSCRGPSNHGTGNSKECGKPYNFLFSLAFFDRLFLLLPQPNAVFYVVPEATSEEIISVRTTDEGLARRALGQICWQGIPDRAKEVCMSPANIVGATVVEGDPATSIP